MPKPYASAYARAPRLLNHLAGVRVVLFLFATALVPAFCALEEAVSKCMVDHWGW